MADQAYDRLIGVLRDGSLGAGQFVSMPGLVELIELPLAATREAVKRADVDGLVRVVPKRGVLVMEAIAAVDARLHGPARHARRRGGAAAGRGRGRAAAGRAPREPRGADRRRPSGR